MKTIPFLLYLFIFGTLIVSCKKKEKDPVNDTSQEKVLKNISYGPDERNRMDVYLPAGRTSETTKLFIWIHGGAWMEGDKSEFANVKSSLDYYLPDYAYISVNYRLYTSSTPDHMFPDQENDIQLAVEYIQSHLNEWNISDKAVIAGASAGGHLCLLQAYKHNTNGFIKATISYFPPTELASFYNYNWFSTYVLSTLTGGTPANLPELYSSSSPINYITSNSVPTVLFHGTNDDVVPLSQSELLLDTLQTYSVPHFHQFFTGEGHGFTTQVTIQSIQQAATFLEEYNP